MSILIICFIAKFLSYNFWVEPGAVSFLKPKKNEYILDTNTNGGSNHQTLINKSGVAHAIGRYGSGTYYFNGYMTHVHFSDGYALAPTVFGSTDSTTGEWKINISPTFTLGTNGFTI